MKISKEQLKKIIKEELEKLVSYSHYDYGLDHIPNKTDAHDDIVGHT